MSFGIKNGLLTYQRAITKKFGEYLDSFMKIFWMILYCIMTWKVIYRSLNYIFKSAKNMALI
jgi:hypothetical protein